MKKAVFLVVVLSALLVGQTMWVRVYYANEYEKELLLLKDFDILTGNAREGYFEYFLDQKIVDDLTTKGYTIKILHPDIINYLKKTYGDLRMTFGYYYTYNEMVQELDSIAAAYPNITKKVSIGTSWQGRHIWAMKISDNVHIREDEPRVLIDAVNHGREPIGCSICMDFIRYLVQNYGTNDTATTIVNNDEVWIVPVVNPDGYVFNETYEDPWGAGWRKNCRDNNGGGFAPADDGVDLNRNYGYMWGYDNTGSSPIPSAETYRGPAPFSEPETQAIRALCNADSFLYVMDYHSYGNYLIYPWSYIDQLTPDSSEYKRMADSMTTKIGVPNNYVYGTASQTVGYVANGVSTDWFYGETTAKPKSFGFTVEVGSGFWEAANDTNLIVQQCNETRPMNIYLCYRAAMTGIEELATPVALNDLSIFPNPVHDKFTISLNLKEPLAVGLKIYDAVGRTVLAISQKEYPAGLNRFDLDASSLPAGVYFLNLSNTNETIRRKLVILR